MTKSEVDQVYLDWVLKKHRHDEYRLDLVKDCRDEFAQHAALDEDMRAAIYGRHRDRFVKAAVSRIRDLAQRCCTD